MATRLKLICHAPTAATRRVAFAADEPVEAKALARLATLPSFALQNVLTSPAVCARQTAEALHCTATVDPALRDCDYGSWAGRTLEAVLAGDPAALAAWMADPAAAPHGGESVCQLIERAGAWLGMRRSGQITAITHAPIIRAAIVHAIGAPPGTCQHIDIAPLSVTELSAHGGRWTLRGIAPLA